MSRKEECSDLISRKALLGALEAGKDKVYQGKTILEVMKEIVENQPTIDGWIPIGDRMPENDNYILLSFSNFSMPIIGRYKEDSEGGAFYLGDCDEKDTCVSQDLYVNAWRPLPKPYK